MKKVLTLIGLSAFAVNAQIDFELITPPPPAPQITHDIAQYRNPAAAVGDLDGNGSLDLIIFGRKPSDDFNCGLHFNDGSGNFSEETNHVIQGVQNGAVALADIDGDGDLDFIVAGATPGLIPYTGLYTNDGNGNFTEVSGTVFPGLRFPDFDFADVDGDGDLDLIIAGLEGTNPTNAITQLYLNDGNGNFTIDNSNSFIGLTTPKIIFADLNGDGSLDLLLTGQNNSLQSTTKIYLNDGNGNFTEDTSHPIPDVGQGGAAVFDANGDGTLDILVMGFNSQSSTALTKLFLNNGNGVFTEETNSSFVTLFYGDISIADIDADGDLDLILSGNSPSSVSDCNTLIYLNDGSGVFSEDLSNSFHTVRENITLFFDLDGDGDEDLFINGRSCELSSTEISQFYINDGSGNFELLLVDMLQPGREAAFSDVNGDGFLDMIVVGSKTALYLNDGNGFYEEVSGTSFVPMSKPAIAFADVDGDGDMDVMLQGFNMQTFPTTTILYLNDGNGNFTEDTNNSFTQLYDNGSLTFGDTDGDGDMDLIQTGKDINNNYFTVFYINDGNGNFTENTSANLINIAAGKVIVEDLNNNGSLDLIISGIDVDNSFMNTTKIYFNDGSGNFTEDTQNQISGHYLGGIDLGDINGDGNVDLVITGYDENDEPMTKLYTSDGAGQFTELTTSSLLQLSDSRAAFSDVDLDGDLDLLIHGADTDGFIQTVLYENDGTGVFTEVTGMPFHNSGYGSILFADIDNDGDEDVLLAGLKGVYGELEFAKLYRNLAINCSPLDATTMVSGATITANNANATYQWVDCDDNNAPIPGETNQSFTATANGNYAVEITENGCTETSDCIAITTVGLDNNKLNTIVMYPNPAKTSVTIAEIAQPSTIVITDLNGRVMFTSATDATSLEIALDNFASGVYLVNVVNEQFKATQKLIVQ